MERRLAAIMAADVVGYSRLVGTDETGTLVTLKSHLQALLQPKVAQYHGRIVKQMGDGLLAEFPSAVEAVQCAIEIQHAMVKRNTGVSKERRITYRIGINIGDIVVEDDDIFGDGVNVAARLEGIAEPEGICVGRNVRDQVRDKLDIDFEDMGEIAVKNIARQVRAYRIPLNDKSRAMLTPIELVQSPRLASRVSLPMAVVAAFALVVAVASLVWWRPWTPDMQPGSIVERALTLPDKPSIAVLPFNNLSGDAAQDYLADGLTENIITALASVPAVFVISRNSTFTYKGKSVQVWKVAAEMGVRYVLEGSIQRAGDRIRVTAQLIDAIRGNHLWSARYDREFSDLFAVEDEITLRIVPSIQVNLTEGELARLEARTSRDLQAWKDYVEGVALLRRFTKEDMVLARKRFQSAINRDSEYVGAWTALGWTYWNDARSGWSKTREASLQMAKQAAEKAISMKADDSGAHALLGGLHLLHGRYDKAIAEGRKAIDLAPSISEHYAVLAISTFYAGDFAETVRLTQKAMRLQPYHPAWYDYRIGVAYMMLRQYDKAISALESWLNRSSRTPDRLIALATALSMAGRLHEARNLVSEAQAIDPSYNLKRAASFHHFKDPAHLKRIVAALRAAGLHD